MMVRSRLSGNDLFLGAHRRHHRFGDLPSFIDDCLRGDNLGLSQVFCGALDADFLAALGLPGSNRSALF